VAKNLAQHGLYAESSSDGPRYYGGPVGIGPTVHLPVALSLRLLGMGVWQARLVPALYLLLCIAAFHALALELGSRRLAWTATALLVVAPMVSLVPLGRRVMGEIPGLFFFLCALLLWFRRWQRHSHVSLVAVGLLFGLAAVSKQQFTLMIDLTLAACAVLNAIHYRLVRHRDFIVPLLVTVCCHLGWSALFLSFIPAEARPGIFANGRAIAAVATLVLPPLAALPGSRVWPLPGP
jgi:4-amino-4-deoxy-L-arabinose transferase-like glycosyltransferase